MELQLHTTFSRNPHCVHLPTAILNSIQRLVNVSVPTVSIPTKMYMLMEWEVFVFQLVYFKEIQPAHTPIDYRAFVNAL